MSTTTEEKVSARVDALITISLGEGLTRDGEISEAVQELFGLDGTDARTLAQNLNVMRYYLVPSNELEAAYYALGIDKIGDPQWRRNSLLGQRHGRTWDTNDSSVLKTEEIRGFYILASSYELFMMFEKLAAAAHEAAKVSNADARARRTLTTVLDEVDPRA